MTTEWIITSATISDSGATMEVSFRAVGKAGKMTNTLDSDTWQRALHIEWMLQREKELTATLAGRIDELNLENRGLRASLISMSAPPTPEAETK